MTILKLLLPRNENEFILPLITVEETKIMLKNLKNTSSTGHDHINNRFIKKVYIEIAPHICHLINAIIIKGKIPNIFKISRITPIYKCKGHPNLLESFRAVNNLICMDKIWEEHVRANLIKFLDNNNIIQPNNHGGRRAHSTTTVLLQITDKLNKQYDRNRISATLTTDLTAAFDTVNT